MPQIFSHFHRFVCTFQPCFLIVYNDSNNLFFYSLLKFPANFPQVFKYLLEIAQKILLKFSIIFVKFNSNLQIIFKIINTRFVLVMNSSVTVNSFKLMLAHTSK